MKNRARLATALILCASATSAASQPPSHLNAADRHYVATEMALWARAGRSDGTYLRRVLEIQQHLRHGDRLSAHQAGVVLAGLGGTVNGIAQARGFAVLEDAFHSHRFPAAELPRAEAISTKALRSRELLARAYAASFLGMVGDRRAIPNLKRLLADSNPQVRSIVARALARLAAR